MRLDQFTVKAQEAITSAQTTAEKADHPEVTPEVANRWLDIASEHLTRRGAQCRVTQSNGMARFDRALHHWLDGFLDRWLAPATAEVGSQGKAVARG